MPYRDPSKQREAVRESARRRRSGARSESPGSTVLPRELCLRTAKGWLGLLEATANAVLAEECDTLAKARTIATLAAVGLKAVETAEMEERIAALEAAQKGRTR